MPNTDIATEPVRAKPYIRLNFPLFFLSTLFLMLILFVTGWNAWQQNQKLFNNEVRTTLNNFAQQSGLLAQASHQANWMFSRSHAELMSDVIAGKPNKKAELWQEMKDSMFNFTGYILLSDEGKTLAVDGVVLDENEQIDAWINIVSFDKDQGMFILRYGNQGGFYFYNSFISKAGKKTFLVVRRAFDKLSGIIYDGHFNGFEMLLIDTRTDTVSMRENFFINSDNQPKFNKHNDLPVIYRTHIPSTHLDVVALPIPQTFYQKYWPFVRQPLLILAFFIFISGILWRVLKVQDDAYKKAHKMRRAVEKRANKALNAIDDILIFTDTVGRIVYVNKKAAEVLKNQGVINDPVGLFLLEAWPDSKAQWCRDFDEKGLPVTKANLPLLAIVTAQGVQLYEQSSHPLYEGDSLEGITWVLRDVSAAENAKMDLMRSQERYKILFEEASIGHFLLSITDLHHQSLVSVVDANSAALKIFQVQSKERFIKEFFKINAEAQKVLAQQLLRGYSLGFATVEFEMPIKTFLDEERFIWVTISLRTGMDHKALVSFMDNTEKKISVEKMREREAFWSKIMDSMSDIIYIGHIDQEGQSSIRYRNRNIGHMLGYGKEFADKTGWTFYADEGEIERLPALTAKLQHLKAGEINEITARFRHANGSLRILKFRDTPFSFNESGLVETYIGTVRDVTDEVEQQEQILESERRYRLMAENISDIIWATDMNMTFNFVSSSVEAILGYKPDELLREGVLAVFRKRDIALVMNDVKQVLRQVMQEGTACKTHNTFVTSDIVAIAKDGKEILLELKASPLWNDAGELQGVIGICRDVSDTRKLEQELRQAAEVFSNSNEGVLITNANKTIVKVNDAFCHITGYDQSFVLGQRPAFFMSFKNHSQHFLDEIDERLLIDGYWQGEVFYTKYDNSVRTCWAGVSAVRDAKNNLQSLIIIISDITDKKLAEEKIHRLAYYDHLTGLPNRSQLSDKLKSSLDSAEKNQQSVALLFIDLDRFKPINDSLGHPVGDVVLQEVSMRLQLCVKERDFICRMGGDEFTLMLAEQESSEKALATAKQVAERIITELNRPYYHQQKEIFLGCSVGVSLYPQDGTTSVELLKNADLAMYHAKETGRNNVQFFTKVMKQKAMQAMELENELRHVLARGELELYYQAQFAATSQELVAAEALLRWNHPSKGLISPIVFIPIVEESGLIVPIGDWVLNQACMQLAQWQKQGRGLKRVAVNVSARQFKDSAFVAKVESAILRSGIAAHQLELELTESILIDNIEHTLQVLHALRALKVRIAIDDFGTGYSSLNYLKQFPVDNLKVDRSFVQNLPENNEDAQITRTIIAMAHNLGLGVIAEGVENAEQLAFLAQLNCEEVQGFYFAKPVPAQDFWQANLKREL